MSPYEHHRQRKPTCHIVTIIVSRERFIRIRRNNIFQRLRDEVGIHLKEVVAGNGCAQIETGT